jgi:hypothetical protein
MYSTQQYAIKFVSDLRQVDGFLVSTTNKTDHHDIADIRVHLGWSGFEFRTLVVIGTDCTGSRKSNYHTITTVLMILDVTHRNV